MVNIGKLIGGAVMIGLSLLFFGVDPTDFVFLPWGASLLYKGFTEESKTRIKGRYGGDIIYV
jgi:hypothetical protein